MSRFQCPGVKEIIAVMTGKGYAVFENGPSHNLNIIGIRTDNDEANTFNDWVTVSYFFDGIWNSFVFPATTDPGTHWRLAPMNVRGTAIMKPGQYRGAYKVGKHKNYKALEQKGPITVYRDANKDATLDVTEVETDVGNFKVNIHRANRGRASVLVDKWSAGCQVFQDPDHFDFFMALCERARANFPANSFTYTLLEESDFGA